jgi:hypothetical protein
MDGAAAGFRSAVSRAIRGTRFSILYLANAFVPSVRMGDIAVPVRSV